MLKLLDKEKILQISRETKGSEAYVKRFDGYQHLVVMLFGILKHFDSLRELEIGMKAEAHKLGHLGMNYLVRRGTLAEANIRRPQEFFAGVYAYLLEKYAKFLADSRPSKCYKGQTHEPKDWEKLLYMMDSTTITLFDNILKGIGRHPKSGKKKGGMKVHTVMKYHVGVPMVVQLTSAAKHDHYLLKEVHLPKDSTLAMDRGYVDVAQFQRLTEEGVCYVTKMKKNLKYEELESITYVNPQGLVTHIDKKVRFTRGELIHEARRVEIFYETKKPVVPLTNNFEFTVEDISEIYRLRWAIESLYYDKYIIMQSKVRSMSVSQRFVRLLLTSTSRNNNHRPRSLSQSRRFLLFSQSLSESRLGIRSAYAFSSASRLAFESALA